MKPIDASILKSLNSFEVSELTRIMEAIEKQEYYACGGRHLCGAYADTEISDLLIGEDYDEETDKEYDLIEFWIETGVQDESHTSSDTSYHHISRRVVGDSKMSLKEKLQTIK